MFPIITASYCVPGMRLGCVFEALEAQKPQVSLLVSGRAGLGLP